MQWSRVRFGMSGTQAGCTRTRRRETFHAHQPAFPMRVAELGTAFLCATLPATACVCEQGRPERAPGAVARELAFYDFAHQPDPAKMSFWRPGKETPNRKKRQLLTRQEGADLFATTDGLDPYFVWDFETPERLGAFVVDVTAEQPGRLQLFWANDDCQVYEERCSTSVTVAAGRQTVDFFLDAARDTRGIRLDLPEVKGAKLQFHSMSALDRTRLSTGFFPRQNHTTAAATPEGLRLSCRTPDPWIVFDTPWLDTAKVEAIEVELSGGGPGKPELFWSGSTCPYFMEKCHVTLEPSDGGSRFVAPLKGVAAWSGAARAVRLDPGPGAGDYLLKSLVFVRKHTSH
jgi:hypothetical protein